jgi:hypothetical protein
MVLPLSTRKAERRRSKGGRAATALPYNNAHTQAFYSKFTR